MPTRGSTKPRIGSKVNESKLGSIKFKVTLVLFVCLKLKFSILGILGALNYNILKQTEANLGTVTPFSFKNWAPIFVHRS